MKNFLLVLLGLAAFSLKANTIGFESNRGQWEQNILFKCPTTQEQFNFFDNGFQCGIAQISAKDSSLLDGWIWSVSLINSNKNAHLKPKHKDLSKGVKHYIQGNKKILHSATYNELWYESIYPGIDWRFYEKSDHTLAYDFIVQPNGNVNDIQLKFDGLDKMYINEQGDLVLETPFGVFKQSAPYSYQIIDNQKKVVRSWFQFKDNNTIGFHIHKKDYNPAYPIVIDPTIMIWSSFVSGFSTSNNNVIKTDAAGNVYIAGFTSNNNFPTTVGAFQTSINNNFDAFISKLRPDGTSLIFSTLFGGSGNDLCYDLALDNFNNVFITGRSNSTNLPTTPNALKTSPNSYDIFLAKLSNDGTSLLYNTFLGGTGTEEAHAIALDPMGNIYLTGHTSSNNFPTTTNAFQSNRAGNNDAFACKISADGSQLLYATYIGGTKLELAFGIALNNNNEAHIIGQTLSSNFPTTSNAYKTNIQNYDAFIVKLNADASSAIYATLFGGSSIDEGNSIVVNANDEAIFTGYVRSSNMPTTANAVQGSFGGFVDTYIAKFNPSGTSLLYSSFYGGSSIEQSTAIGLDAQENIYLSGFSASSNFPTTECSFPSSTGTDYDGFLLKLSPDGSSLLGASDIGGSNDDRFFDMTVNSTGDMFFCGTSNGNNFPVSFGAFQTTNSTSSSTIVGKAKFDDILITNELLNTIQYTCINGATELILGSNPSNYLSSLPIILQNNVPTIPLQFRYLWQESNDSLSWNNIPSAITQHYLPPPTATPTYFRRITMLGDCLSDTSNVHSLYLNGLIAPNITLPNNQIICGGGSVTLNSTVTNGTSPYLYEWSPNINLDDDTISTPIATPSQSTVYTLQVTDNNGCTSFEQTIVNVATADAGNDVNACNGGIRIGTFPTPNIPNLNYTWLPSIGLDNPNSPQPIANPDTATTYTLTISGGAGCPSIDDVRVTPVTVLIDAGADRRVCLFDTIILGTPPLSNYTYTWNSPLPNLDDINLAQPTLSQDYIPNINPLDYYLTVLDNLTGCVVYDTIQVQIDTLPDFFLAEVYCPTGTIMGDTINRIGVNYTWSPITDLNNPNAYQTTVTSLIPSNYTLTTVDGNGCTIEKETTFFPDCVLSTGSGLGNCQIPNIDSLDGFFCLDTPRVIGPVSDSTLLYEWSPSIGLSNPLIANPTVSSTGADMVYILTMRLASSPSLYCQDTIKVYAPDTSLYLQAQDAITCLESGVMIGDIPLQGFSYDWQPSLSLNDSSLAQPTANPLESTTYTITAIQDTTGCKISDTLNVIIQSISANAGDDRQFCGGAFLLLGSPPAPHQVYNWSPSIGLSDPNIAQPSINLFTDISFILTVTDTLTGCIKQDTVAFFENSALFANAGPDTLSVCENSLIRLGTSDSTSLGYQYNWAPTNSLDDPTKANPIASPTENTIYTLVVSNPDYIGCNGVDMITVLVDTNTTAPTITLNDTTICKGNPTTIGLTSLPNYTYTWSPSTGLNNPASANPEALLFSPMSYLLSVYDNNSGCATQDDIQIDIDAPIVNAGTDTLLCNGGNALIGMNPIANTIYNWSPDLYLDNNTTAQTISQAIVSTVYTLQAIDTLTGCSEQDSVLVETAAIASLNIGDTTICRGDTVLIQTVDSASFSYAWSPSTYVIGARNTSELLVAPIVARTYTLNVSNPLYPNCPTTSQVTINVLSSPPYTPSSDKIICQGNSVTIGTFPINYLLYEWLPNYNLSSTQTGQTQASPDTNTIYNLTVTDTITGCQSFDEILVSVNSPPIADAGDTLVQICTNAGVILGTTDSSAFGFTYNWTPTTGLSNPNSANPIASPSSTTTYTLTVNNGGTSNCSNTDTIRVEINNTNAPVLGITNKSVCEGQPTLIGLPNTNANWTFNWQPNTGLNDPTTAQTLAFTNQTTSYTLTITDQTTLCTSIESMTLFVDTLPKSDAGFDKIVCQNDSLLIGTMPKSTQIYSWFLNNISLQTNNSQIVIKPIQSDYYSILTIDTNTSCGNIDSVFVEVLPLPIANAGLDINTCGGDTIGTFTGAYAYAWQPTIGLENPLAPTPFANPTDTTDYILTVTDSLGCSNTDTVRVSPIQQSAINQLVVCQGQSVQLGIPASANTTYIWSPATGLDNPFVAQPVANPLQNITYTLTKQTGNCTIVETTQLFVLEATIEPSNDTIVCQNSRVQIGTSPLPNYQYFWSPTTGLNDASIAQPIATLDSNTIVYTVLAQNLLTGCIARDTIIVGVVPNPIPEVDAGLDAFVCDNTPALIGDTAVNDYIYTWSPTTGLSNPNIAQTTANPLVSTTYMLTAIDSFGCTNTDAITVSPIVLDVDATSDQSACFGATVRILTDYMGPGRTYSWSPSIGISDTTLRSPFVSPPSTTTYTLTVTDLASGCAASDDITIFIDPVNTSIVDAGNDQSICLGQTATLGNSNNPTGITYQWIGANISNSSSPMPTATPTTNTNYTLIARSASNTSCSSQDQVFINVSPPPAIDAGMNQSYCLGDANGVAIGTNSNSAYTYTWTPTTGLDDPNSAQTIARPSGNTTYTLTVSDANCPPITDNVTVQVFQEPVADAGIDTIACPNIGLFIGAFPASAGYTYSWSPSTYLDNPNSAQPFANPTNDISYALTVQHLLSGCTNQDTIHLEMNPCGVPILSQMPQDTTVNCEGIPSPILTASNDCGNVVVNFQENIIAGHCPNQYDIKRTWSAIEPCGSNASHEQTITVIDTTPPQFLESPNGLDRTVPCDNSILYTQATSLVPTPYDNCASITPLPEPSQFLVTEVQCVNNIRFIDETRIWSYTDDCGNTSEYQQVIRVIDTTKHYFGTAPGDLDQSFDVDTTGLFDALNLSPHVIGYCAPVIDLLLSQTDDSLFNDCGGYDRIRTWTYTDPCTEYSITYTQNLHINWIDWDNCRRDSYEPNNTPNQAADLYNGLGTSTFGLSRICPHGDEDWFKFTVPSDKHRVTIRLNDLPANYDLELYDDQLNLINSSNDTCTNDELIKINYLNDGQYFIKIRNNFYSHKKAYHLSITIHTDSTSRGGTKAPVYTPFPFKMSADNAIYVYPNPISHKKSLNIVSNKICSKTFKVFDLQGIMIFKEYLDTNDKHTFAIPNTFKTGIYIIVVESEQEHIVSKLIVY